MKLIIMFANVVFFLIDIDLLYFISFNVFCFVLSNLDIVNMRKLQVEPFIDKENKIALDNHKLFYILDYIYIVWLICFEYVSIK